MTPLEIVQIAVLTDNYIYLIHDPASGATAVIDPAVAKPVLQILTDRRWSLTHVLNTHHHDDHVGGNLALKQATGATIVGPIDEAARIPGIDVQVGDGDRIAVGAATAQVFLVPGHTAGHIAYWFADSDALFCGDTIFALGCGRLFEGTAAHMWRSLKRLRQLPDLTRVYCAHEYTQANARFAQTIEPGSPQLMSRIAVIDDLRRRGLPTVPSLLADEKTTNPFLRADVATVQEGVGLRGADPTRVFAELRQRKNVF
jgi:hydroxyacylglutathione hydrolase